MSLDAGLKERFDRVRPALAVLRRLDRDLEEHGAESHEYELSPPETEERLAAFERRYGITIPADYRAFLGHVGGRGAGRAYGLLGIEELEDDDARIVSRGERFHPFDKSLRLCELGCGYFEFLVLEGPSAGEVWSDHSSSDQDIHIQRAAPGFLDWYERWLDDMTFACACTAARRRVLDGERGADPVIVARLPRSEQRCNEYPTNNFVRWQRAYLLLHAGRLEDADALLATTDSATVWDLDARLGRASIAADRGDLEGALAVLEGAIQRSAGPLAAARRLHLTLLRRAGRAMEARAAAEDLLRRAGDGHPFYHIEHAFLLASNGDLEGAQATLVAAEARFRSRGMEGLSEWVRRLSDRCTLLGRPDLAAVFDARAGRLQQDSREEARLRWAWARGTIGRGFIPRPPREA